MLLVQTLSPAEQSVIGLTCCLVGVFFLANSIIFRKLKNVIASFFGVKQQSLNHVKDYTLNNLQVAFGFVFLAVGFLIQMYAHLGGIGTDPHNAMWWICGGIVVFAFVVYLIGKSHSRHTFKKFLRKFFQEHPEAFNTDINVTKEVGEFLGVVHTVEDYLERVRAALRMPQGREEIEAHQGGGLAPEGGRRRRDLGGFQSRG